jgi:hypothetical protein
MRIEKCGCTRRVLLIGRWAVKVAWGVEHRHFLYGCYANVSERQHCVRLAGDPRAMSMVARSLWCSWFGLVQIQERVSPLLRDLDLCERLRYNELCGGDWKRQNFGMRGGMLVCVDYP